MKLQASVLPSRGQLIVLLDEEGQVLGTRHLKSGECVGSGKKCSFPGYLIEIGEATNLTKVENLNLQKNTWCRQDQREWRMRIAKWELEQQVP